MHLTNYIGMYFLNASYYKGYIEQSIGTFHFSVHQLSTLITNPTAELNVSKQDPLSLLNEFCKYRDTMEGKKTIMAFYFNPRVSI